MKDLKSLHKKKTGTIPYLLLAMVILLSFGCKKQDRSQPLSQENVVGFWVNPQYNDSTIVFERAGQLIKDNFGIAIYNDYTLTERKNSGWCGTPPIVYGDYQGNWTKDGDMLNIHVGFWGGTASLKWQILSVDDQHLKVKELEAKFIE